MNKRKQHQQKEKKGSRVDRAVPGVAPKRGHHFFTHKSFDPLELG
jgi:hypothetical protein